MSTPASKDYWIQSTRLTPDRWEGRLPERGEWRWDPRWTTENVRGVGRDGQERIAKLVRDNKVDCTLLGLIWPTGSPEKCDISDLIKDGVIGIRNWGRIVGGTASQKSLGATSLSDVARCVLNTLELDPVDPSDPTTRQFQLEFEKVSGTPQPRPILYSVKDRSEGREETSHLREVLWGEPLDVPTAKKAVKEAARKRVAKKGSGRGNPTK